MEGTYEVIFAGRPAGQVELSRQGLYCRLRCRCQWLDTAMYDLWRGNMSLGLLRPKGNELVLDTSFPMKRLQESCGSFQLRPRHGKMPENFVPVYPEEPFSYLRRLENAYLAIKDGQMGVVLDAQKNVK